MTFKTGTLARPIGVVKTGHSVVLHASLASAGPFERVFAKLGDVNQRCIEAVCAWIAAEIGLPCPEARFARVLKAKVPKETAWPYENEDERTVFATLEIPFARPLTKVDSGLVSARLAKWSYLEKAGVYDHLIANDDRSDGNLLIDGRGQLWLIDQGRSLGGGGHPLFSNDALPSFRNFFLHQISREPLASRAGRKNVLVSASAELAACASRIPYEALLVPDTTAHQIDSFLGRRAHLLQAMVLDVTNLSELYDNSSSVRGVQ